jgi:hypothetical protein
VVPGVKFDADDLAQIQRALSGLIALALIAAGVIAAAWILGIAFRIFVETAGLR